MKSFLFLLLFIFPTTVFAAKSITFTVDKSNLKLDEEMNVTASASGFAAGEQIYIKGAFYKDGSSNYFGYTKKNDGWIKNSAGTTDQRLVTIDSWDGKIIVKSDFSDSGFTETGSYKFKVGYYTLKSTNEPNSVDWSSSVVDVNLEKPIPTNTPQPTATLTPTSTPNPTSVPTSTAKPTLTSIPTLKPTLKSSPTPTEQDEEEVLGTENESSITNTPESTPTPTIEIKPQNSSKNRNIIITLLFVGAGTGLLSAVLFINRRKIP